MRPVSPETITKPVLRRGLRDLVLDSTMTQSMLVLTTGAFLVAFALELGATNRVIGLIAAIGPLAQLLQIPSLWLVERLRWRKAMTVASVVVSRLVWVPVALLPWWAPAELRVPLLLLGLGLFFGLGAVGGCAYNSWIRDLVPTRLLGRHGAARMRWAIGTGAVLSIIASGSVDVAREVAGEGALMQGYAALFVLGGVGFGMAGAWFLSRVPEPRMAPATGQSVGMMLREPLRDGNYRQLLWFLAAWNFAVNLGGPFIVVYMLKRLEMPLSLVIAMGVVSQLVNILFLKAWGVLADRFSHKAVLGVSGLIFVASFLIWPMTTLPGAWLMSLPLAVLFFIVTGVASAGLVVSAGGLAMKLAPREKATAYLAVNTVISGVAATISPILAGLLASYVEPLDMTLTLSGGREGDASSRYALPAVSLQGLDFLFVLTFIAGLYAIHRLLAVRETGESPQREVVVGLLNEVRRSGQAISNIQGMRNFTTFPFGALRSRQRSRRRRERLRQQQQRVVSDSA